MQRLLQATVLALLSVGFAANTNAQTVKTVVQNGPSAELYDVVILGDGYRAAEQAQFDADVQAIVNGFRADATKFPYGAYFHCYNFHSVFRASNQSGADKPPLNVYVDTAYDASYWTGGTERCLYVQNSAQAARDAALAPDSDGRVIVLVNDAKYGGCASTYSVSYNGSSMWEVQAHEWAHSFAGVADEYDYGYSGTYSGPEPREPNITKSATGAKWQPWIAHPGQYSTVGAYVGAGYYPAGLYRPESNCQMRALGLRFCTICREQLVKSFNQQCTMLHQPTPATVAFAAAQHTTVPFTFMNRLSGRPHTIEWRVDAGTWQPGGERFAWAIGSSTTGAHTVAVRLRDTSPEVRQDPTNLLLHTHTWTVNVTPGAAAAGDLAVVLPAAAATNEGNGATPLPWGGGGGMRVLQAYGRNMAAGRGPMRLRGVSFRPDGGSPPLAGATFALRLDVSTSRQPAASLLATFDQNHGADRTTVFDGVIVVPPAPLGTTPEAFVLKVPFVDEFTWDPTCGPLLLDLRVRGVSGGGTVPSWDGVGGGGGHDVGRIAHLSNADAAVATWNGGATDPFALVARLDVVTDVVPAALARTEGAGASALPWSAPGGARVQSVYEGATLFPFAGPVRVTRLHWRADGGAAFTTRTYDVRVTLSTGAPGLAGSLTATFAANHGADATVVYDGALVVPPAAAGSPVAPAGVQLELQRPFVFDPARGALVVDVQVRSATGTAPAFTDTSGAGTFAGVASVSHSSSGNATVADAPPSTEAPVLGVGTVPWPVLPVGAAAAEGASVSPYPWGTAGASRAMDAYDGAALGVTAPLFVTHLSWRQDGGSAPFGPVTYDCRIDLSTGHAAAHPLHLLFDQNHGADRVQVYDGPISAVHEPNGGLPAAWTLTVRLDTPFRWDPARGPLLVDVRERGLLGGGTLRGFDVAPANASELGRLVHTSNANALGGDLAPQAAALVLRLGGVGSRAQAVPYGAGCGGSAGVPIASTRGLPVLPNPDFAFALHQARAQAPCALIVGTARASTPLDFLGAPGCTLWNDARVLTLGAGSDAQGRALIPLRIPDRAEFQGILLPFQWSIVDPTANAASLATSAGLELRVD